MQIDTFEDLKRRFPILEAVITHLGCDESDKRLLRELLVAIYTTAYEDGRAAARVIR